MNEALVQIGALDPAVGNFVFPLVQALDAHPALHTVFTIIALLGSEYFYIPAVLLIFWCIDRERGFKLGQLVLVSAWINGWLRACRIEAWYDLPSPAVQVSLCFWFFAAVWVSRVWFWVLAVCMILLIGFTQTALAIDLPIDIVSGALAGALVLALFYLVQRVFWLKGRVEKIAISARARVRLKLLIVAFISLGMNKLYPQERRISAIFLGFCAGSVLWQEIFLPKFAVSVEVFAGPNTVFHKITLAILGSVGLVLLYGGLTFILPGEGSALASLPFFSASSPVYAIGAFLRYGILGLWCSAGVFWVSFKRQRKAND
ncbi:hypothetical protein FACS1894200_03200 [Spirochaetia bacterium]|nr:hypothetical protein FACS1894200_03200 [Spirochaetia bacterium]